MSRREVVAKFRLFDRDSDGKIDRTELEQTLLELDPSWTSENLDVLLLEADLNKDQRIDIEEFAAFVFGGSSGKIASDQIDEVRQRFKFDLAKLPKAEDSVHDSIAGVDFAERLQTLRANAGILAIPMGLDGRISQFHFRTHSLSGTLDFKLCGMAPEGDGNILLELQQTGGYSATSRNLTSGQAFSGNHKFVYRLRQDGQLTDVQNGLELFEAAVAAVPRELRLVCFLSLMAGGGEVLPMSTIAMSGDDGEGPLDKAVHMGLTSKEVASVVFQDVIKHYLVTFLEHNLEQLFDVHGGELRDALAEARAASAEDLLEFVGGSDMLPFFLLQCDTDIAINFIVAKSMAAEQCEGS